MLNQGVLIAGLSILKAWFAGLIKLRAKGLALWSIFYSHKVHLDWLLQIQGLLINVKWSRFMPNFHFNISFLVHRSQLNCDNVRKKSQPVIFVDSFKITATERSMTGSPKNQTSKSNVSLFTVYSCNTFFLNLCIFWRFYPELYSLASTFC